MCRQCEVQKLQGLASYITGGPEPRTKVKGASVVPRIRLGPRPEPTRVQVIERQVKLAELGKLIKGVQYRNSDIQVF